MFAYLGLRPQKSPDFSGTSMYETVPQMHRAQLLLPPRSALRLAERSSRKFGTQEQDLQQNRLLDRARVNSHAAGQLQLCKIERAAHEDVPTSTKHPRCCGSIFTYATKCRGNPW